jgi:hypothetical protein
MEPAQQQHTTSAAGSASASPSPTPAATAAASSSMPALSSGSAEATSVHRKLLRKRKAYAFKASDAILVWNSSHEPCLKYSANLFSESVKRPRLWTAQRLKHEVLYFESGHTRYEVARETDSDRMDASSSSSSSSASSGSTSSPFDSYRLSEVQNPTKWSLHPLAPSAHLESPLPASAVSVLERGLDWTAFEFGASTLRIRNKIFPLDKVAFKCRSDSAAAAATADDPDAMQ